MLRYIADGVTPHRCAAALTDGYLCTTSPDSDIFITLFIIVFITLLARTPCPNRAAAYKPQLAAMKKVQIKPEPHRQFPIRKLPDIPDSSPRSVMRLCLLPQHIAGFVRRLSMYPRPQQSNCVELKILSTQRNDSQRCARHQVLCCILLGIR